MDTSTVRRWITTSPVSCTARRRARQFLMRPPVNRAVTTVLRPLGPVMPHWVLLRLQVARTVVVGFSGLTGPLRFDNTEGTDPIACLLYWQGEGGWEPETTGVFLHLLEPGSVVLDVGANTGLFALLAARADPSIQVHAFEPVPRVFTMLERNKARNDLPNVVCHPIALSDRSGEVTFFVPEGPVPVMGSMESNWRGGQGVETTVAALTVDDLAGSTITGNIRLIKIDVEGAEHRVLRGAMTTIAQCRPIIICELLADSSDRLEVFELLEHAGYVSFHLAAQGPRRCTPLDEISNDCRNYLFVPAESVNERGIIKNLGATTL